MRTIAIRVTALTAVFALLAGACGGVGTPAPQPSPTTPAGAAATATPDAGPTFGLSTFMYAIQTTGKLRVGTQEDNPPFSVKDPATNEWKGFDVDFAKEVAKEIFGEDADLDTVIEWVPVTSATRIGVLQENQADVVIKTFTVNEERKQQIDFSATYFFTGQRILVKKDNTDINNVADLAGKTVCTQRGSTSEQNITAKSPEARLLQLDSYPACLLALQQGSADAVSTDETILFGLVGQDPNTKIVGPYFSNEPYGIGIAKEKTGMDVFLNSLIVEMIEDGRWADLYETHITPVSGDVKTSPHDRGTPAN
ncbi:MAG: glutamate ABC transporter substrate-binding protein [Candidatus Limnocylindria bacterium]